MGGACDIGAAENQSGSGHRVIEAEDGQTYSPVVSGTDDGLPPAFHGGLIETPAGTGDDLDGDPEGRAIYTFTVGADAQYTVWVRMFAPDAGSNSFWESMDTGAETALQVPSPGAWIWVRGQSYGLTRGSHSFELGHRHDGAKADRIIITDDPGYDPSGESPGERPPDVGGLHRTDAR
jgi:hypothetical protein